MVDAYAARVALNCGVARDDVEDVLQEARIRQWRAPHVGFTILVRRSAIDWLRRFGPRSRKGDERTVVYRAQVLIDAPYEVVERVADFQRAWPKLTRRQRDGIEAVLRGGSTPLEQSLARYGRQKLRVLTAAG